MEKITQVRYEKQERHLSSTYDICNHFPLQAAKIMFVIHEPVQRRESFTSRKPQRFLYWGLTSIFDHQ